MGLRYLWSFGLGFFLFSICGISVADSVPEEEYESVSGDPRRVSVSGKGQSLSVKCLHSGAVAGDEIADRAASSAPQGWQH